MRNLFGTDGVRGKANTWPMTPEVALQLGRSCAYIFKREEGRRHRIVIGKDTRLSGYLLESALTSGICSMGVDVLLVGPIPTPAISFITRSLRADAGVVISGSHNKFDDNGIKFFSASGMKLPDKIEKEMEEIIFSGELDELRPTADEIGKAYRVFDAEGRYIEFAKNSLPKGMDFSGIKIVVDCANGSAYKVTPAVLNELGADVTVLADRPNGININNQCGSLYPELLREEVLKVGADIGIAHDGDADRVILVSEKGDLVDGDYIMTMAAMDMMASGSLNKNTIVSTVMSNMGMEVALSNAGIKMLRTNVGDRYVLEKMIAGGYNLGGEQSGHIIFSDYNTTGDGLITALQVIRLMSKKSEQLSQLCKCMEKYPQIIENVEVKEKKDLGSVPRLAGLIKDIEVKLGNEGRLVIRYSGTEMLLRIMIEGKYMDQITSMANELVTAVKQHQV